MTAYKFTADRDSKNYPTNVKLYIDGVLTYTYTPNSSWTLYPSTIEIKDGDTIECDGYYTTGKTEFGCGWNASTTQYTTYNAWNNATFSDPYTLFKTSSWTKLSDRSWSTGTHDTEASLTISGITGSEDFYLYGMASSTYEEYQIRFHIVGVLPSPPFHVNVTGTWKDATPYVNVSGTWKEVKETYVNVNGSWKEIK